jgi:hypothetical protein
MTDDNDNGGAGNNSSKIFPNAVAPSLLVGAENIIKATSYIDFCKGTQSIDVYLSPTKQKEGVGTHVTTQQGVVRKNVTASARCFFVWANDVVLCGDFKFFKWVSKF